MFKRTPPKTTQTVRIPRRLHEAVERLAATIDGARSGDVLELCFETMAEIMARLEAAKRAPDTMAGTAPEIARLLVDHYSLVVAERVGATMPPDPPDGEPAVPDPETTRMFQ